MSGERRMKDDSGYLRVADDGYFGVARIALVDYAIEGTKRKHPETGEEYLALEFNVTKERVPGEDDQ